MKKSKCKHHNYQTMFEDSHDNYEIVWCPDCGSIRKGYCNDEHNDWIEPKLVTKLIKRIEKKEKPVLKEMNEELLLITLKGKAPHPYTSNEVPPDSYQAKEQYLNKRKKK